MTSSVLRGALIGFGGVAEHGHLPGYLRDPRFEICAVVDPEQAARERAVRASGDRIRSYSSLAACLSSERLDFVDIATPPSEHLEAIERAAGAGLHVLVEKPLALTFEEALRVQRAARRGEVALTVVHNWHHAPPFRAAREALEGGAIGAPDEVEFVTERTEPAGGGARSWRLDAKIAGGGILVDHGWHQLYLARALLGGRDPQQRAGGDRAPSLEGVLRRGHGAGTRVLPGRRPSGAAAHLGGSPPTHPRHDSRRVGNPPRRGRRRRGRGAR